jgi:hypothetical protein
VEQRERQVTPSYDELERALSSVPGIVTASVAVAEGTGRGRLRIRLAPGEDPEQVAWAVAATLRERFGISLDPETIRPRLHEEDPAAAVPAAGDGRLEDPGPLDLGGHAVEGVGDVEDVAAVEAPAHPAAAGTEDPRPRAEGRPRGTAEAAIPTPPSPPGPDDDPELTAPPTPAALDPAGDAVAQRAGPRVRAAIRDLVTRQGDDDVEVTATLEVAGRRGRAAATAVPTRRGVWRAVAEATIGALRELTDDHLRAGVDRVSVTSHEDPGMVTVVLTVLSDRGEETLLGASLLRDDPESAVMRATLDALNRRIEPWLQGAPHAGPTGSASPTACASPTA